MSSNRVVTYIDINLNSVGEYWSQLVVPDVRAFQSAPCASSVFHVAQSVWHLHDWVWHDRNPGQDSRGTAFNSFRSGLLVACPELGWLRDVADAGKHRGLGRLPEVKGAQPQRVASLPLLLNSILKFYLVLNDGSKQDVDRVLRTAIDFWRTELKAENLPSPFDHPFENT